MDTQTLDETDRPLLDLSGATLRRLIKQAKQRGFVTQGEINDVLPSKEYSSEQIEDVLGQLSAMGISVVEAEEADEGQPAGEEAEGGDLVEASQTRAIVLRASVTQEPVDRSDDPTRMYLREMGAVLLLSREGEIAIAKRIEAGREAMIAGLCESPLTFQAIIIWRDELVAGQVLLRHIIDLGATYAGPDGAVLPKGEGIGKDLPEEEQAAEG
ncbi:RNA polymerase sigma factor region1.1 domain-containing protein, partial [Microvirga aerophila]|uniref:RNA polymerase sigma factor region1.1 domain-containing protein n=1 Tax=Microvirga aerophila TaxID=670291 RepID=UPI0023ED360C